MDAIINFHLYAAECVSYKFSQNFRLPAAECVSYKLVQAFCVVYVVTLEKEDFQLQEKVSLVPAIFGGPGSEACYSYLSHVVDVLYQLLTSIPMDPKETQPA